MSSNNRNLIFSIKKVKNQKKWTREEDELLIILAQKFNEKHWKEISRRFLKKNSLQCFSRYKRIRPGIIKGSWKKEEDIEIISLVEEHGKSWSKISKIMNTRNGKQIRDRFINVLDPEIKKGKFTDEEDIRLISLFQELGPKWATIAKFYPLRTADMIKNRFHSSIKKKFSNCDTSILTPLSNDETLLNKIKQNYNEELSQNSKFETEDSLKEFNFDLDNLNNSNNLNKEKNFYTSKFDSFNNSPSYTNDDFYNYSSSLSLKEYSSKKENIFADSKQDTQKELIFNHNAWNFDDFFTV